MAQGRTDLTLQTTDEEIDRMKFLTLIRHLRLKFGMTEDEAEKIEEVDARAELKKRMREVREKAKKGRRAGQAAENLRQILASYNSKRARLAELCRSIAAILPRLDKGTKDILKTQFGRIEDILTGVQTQLRREECPILVAGETSSGKSTFLNLLLGENILSVAHMSSTSTICEVKYGETRQAVVHLRKPGIMAPKTVTIPLDGTEERQQELDSYVHVKGASRESDDLPPAERVEIFWPLPLLQGGIVLVDSPGVGETETMGQVVADYIPKAFAFLYIIDSSRAGGVQQDRLGRLLQLYAKKENDEDFNPESAMFICNKWDLVLANVSPEEQEEVKSETLRKLSAMWDGLEESQVFFVSTKKECAVGPFGILSEDFSKVLDGLDLLLPKSLDIKLDTQYRLLSRLLRAALVHVDSVLNVASQNLDRDTKMEMFRKAQKHLRSFEEETNMRMEALRSLMSSQMEPTKDKLSSLVESGKLKKDTLNAVGLSWIRPLPFRSWYNNSLAKLKDKKKEWSGENFSKLKDLYAALADDLAHCPSFEDHVTSIERHFEQAMKEAVESLESAHRQTMHACSCGSDAMGQMDIRDVLFHKTSFWERFSAFWKGLSLSSLSSRLERLGKSIAKAVLGSQSKADSILSDYWERAPKGTPLVDILIQALSSEKLITELAERQMQPQRDLMAVLEADITKMRTIMEHTIEHTFKDTRNNEEIVAVYQPQSREINSFLGQLAMFRLTEMRKYEYELDSITGWTDTRNRIGRGSFGEVYRVQVPWKGAETPAAVKLGLMPYDIIRTGTAWEFLKEEDNLGKLKGAHIVEYYGSACKKEEDGLRLGLVMELCEGTLESRIIGNRDHNPAWCASDPEKQAAAFSYTQNLAVQLCEGLKHIHDAGYMHRDLKLTNILVTTDDTVKLADVGLTKREVDITGTPTGTPLYAAPEVKERKVYDKSADIYSLGLILWEMWYGRTLYGFHTEEAAYAKEMEEDLKKGRDIKMPQWQGIVPPIHEWTSLIHDCLKKDPKERPKIQDCLDRIKAIKVANIRVCLAMAETVAALPTEEEIDQMRPGTITRLLREEFGMTSDETDEMKRDEARAELKKRIRDIRAAAATRRHLGQAAESLRDILGLHNSKRARLAEFCRSIAAYLPSLDRSIQENLKTQFGCEVEDILTDVQTQLHREECPILVAGETSSGKTTLLNLLLGEKILPVSHLSSTSTICEVKYGKTRQAVVHLREANEQGHRQITIPLDSTWGHWKELKHYIHLEGASRSCLPRAQWVEIFLPHPLLQGGIVLVDSPGVGESEMMDQVVADYIPKAFAFLYIIDSSRAGGVQQDRLYKAKENAEDFNPQSAMFICNKWDLVLANVSPEEQEEVKSETLRKLSAMWPGLEESQVFFVSTKMAVGLGGILSEDFSKVLDGLDLLLQKSLDIKLETQYRLLTLLLSAALTHINVQLSIAHQHLDKEAEIEKYQGAKEHLKSFEDTATRSVEKLESMFKDNVETTKNLLSGLVKDGDLKNDLMAVEKLPGIVSKLIPTDKKVKHQDVLAKLVHERKDKDFSRLKDLYKGLADTLAHCPSFQRSIPSVEMSDTFKEELKEVASSIETAQQQAMSFITGSSYKVPHMDVMREILSKTPLLETVYDTIFRGLTMSSLHWPGRWSRRIAHLQQWEAQGSSETILQSYWEQAPEGTPLVDILFQALSSEKLITDLTERQMQPQRNLMAVLEADITKMRTIMERTIDETFKDTRGKEEMKQVYRPQSWEVRSFLGQLAMFYLNKLRKYEYELDSIAGWTDTRNRIGGGSFTDSEVYRVQVPWKEAETQEAALIMKLGLYSFTFITTETAWDFLLEEEKLRKLKGDHIVEYYGTAYRWEGDDLRLGLVMELCEGTLEDRIIGQRDHNPAWWKRNLEKKAAAFSYTQNLAVQLCEGLKHIHDAGYIHRDLKLTNIMVTKDDTVKLADVGLTKRDPRDDLKTRVGPFLPYAAPEVKERKVYDKSADIYSLGLILWEMWYGRALYAMTDGKMLAYVRRMEEDLKEGRNIRMPEWPDAVPPIPEWTGLIHDCLKKDPRKRPEIQDCRDRIKAMKDPSSQALHYFLNLPPETQRHFLMLYLERRNPVQ